MPIPLALTIALGDIMKHTQEELDEAALADMRVELMCAIRDGLTDYEAEMRGYIARVERGESAHAIMLAPSCSICRRKHGPEVTHACE